MIPLKLEKLLSGRVVEQERVEYKKGWNPGDVTHTMCAYANDFNNSKGNFSVLQSYWTTLYPAVWSDRISRANGDLFVVPCRKQWPVQGAGGCLFEKFTSVPFDDRIEQRATIDDIRRAYLEDFLRESGSALAMQINKIPIEDLLVSLIFLGIEVFIKKFNILTWRFLGNVMLLHFSSIVYLDSRFCLNLCCVRIKYS